MAYLGNVYSSLGVLGFGSEDNCALDLTPWIAAYYICTGRALRHTVILAQRSGFGTGILWVSYGCLTGHQLTNIF